MPYRDDAGRVTAKTSMVAGEPLSPRGLKPGEVAVNAADGRLLLSGAGGTRATVQTTSTPNRNMVVSDTSWPVIQASLQATISSATDIAYEEKVCPTPTGWVSTCIAGPIVHAWGGKVVVFWFNNSAKTVPTKPFVWDVESNTIDEDYFDDSALLPWYANFDAVMASDGAIVCPGFTDGYGPVRLLFPDGTCYVFPAGSPGDIESTWQNNGTFFMNGTRSRVGITPDAGNQWVAFYNASTGKMGRVANNWNDAGTSPALRSGIVLPNGKTLLHRGRASGQYRVTCWDQSLGQVVLPLPASYIPYCDTAAVLPDGRVLLMPLANPHVDVFTPMIWDPYDTSRNALVDAATFDQTAYGPNAAFYGCLLSPLGTIIATGSNGTNLLEYDPGVGVLGEFGVSANTNRRQHQIAYVGIPGGWVAGMNGQGAAPFAWRAWDRGFDLEITNSAFMGKPS